MFVLLWITQEQHFWFHSQTKHFGSVEAIKHQHTYRLCGHPHSHHTEGRLSWNKLVRHVTIMSRTLLTFNKTCLWCSVCANESQRTETGPIVDGWFTSIVKSLNTIQVLIHLLLDSVQLGPCHASIDQGLSCLLTQCKRDKPHVI